MIITQIRLRNVGPFEDLDLGLSRGSVGVFGRNGSGKTTLLNSLYALATGDFSRFSSVKLKCVRDGAGAKADSFISGRLEHGEHVVDIRRSIQPNFTAVSVDGGKEITNADKAQEEINRVIGADRHLLGRYCFKQQDAIADIINDQPAVRAQAFALLCRTSWCEKAHETLARFAEKNTPGEEDQDDYESAQAEMKQLSARSAELDAESEGHRALLLNAKSLASAKKIVASADALAVATAALADATAAVAEAKGSRTVVREKYERAKAAADAAADEVRESAPAAERAREALVLAKGNARARAARKELAARAAELAASLAARARPARPPRGYENAADVSETLARNRRRLEEARKIYKAFSQSGAAECPTCGTSAANLGDVIAEAERDVNELPARVAADQKAVDEYAAYAANEAGRRASVEKDEAVLAGLRASLSDADGGDEVDEASLNRLVSEFNAASSRYAELRRRYDDVRNVLAVRDAMLAEKKAAKEDLEARLAALQDAAADEQKTAKARRRLEEHREATRQLELLEARSDELRRRKRELAARLAKMEAAREHRLAVAAKAAAVGRVAQLFHRKGLPMLVADSNLARAMSSVNKNLKLFGSPFWASSDKNLAFVAHKPGGNPPEDASRLSTGQRAVLCLSFWLSVSSLWAGDLGLLVLDEPTANLDEENRSYLRDAMSTMSRRLKGSRQLIMVTHDPSMRPAFDQVVEL